MKPGERTLRHLLSPIQAPLSHENTTDIVIQRPGQVGVLQDEKWSWIDVPEFSFQRLDAISILAGRLLAKNFDAANSIVETTLPDGHRYTALRPPATPSGISISIRKPRKHFSSGSISDLTESTEHLNSRPHPADTELLRLYEAKLWDPFFALAVRARKRIAATGEQASGKTTFLRRIMQNIDPGDRVVTVEDTEEFLDLPVGQDLVPLRNRVSIIFGGSGISAEKAILTSLRMKADRVAIQELRHAESYAFLRIHQAGQTGSFTTWHAQPDDPFTPLALMIKAHPDGREIPSDELRAMIQNLVDIVAHCHRDPATKKFSLSSVYFKAANQSARPADKRPRKSRSTVQGSLL